MAKPGRKAGLTTQDHIEMGRNLRQAYELLLDVQIRIYNQLGKDSRSFQAAKGLPERVNKLKSVLEDQMCLDGTEPNVRFEGVYRGPSDREPLGLEQQKKSEEK